MNIRTETSFTLNNSPKADANQYLAPANIAMNINEDNANVY